MIGLNSMKGVGELGYIKLDRCICESDIWTGGNKKEKFDRAHAWVDLLLMANYKTNVVTVAGKQINIQRGQVLTTIKKLSERWDWAENTVRSFLRYLEGVQMLSRTDGPKCVILTITNYEKYQTNEGVSSPSTIPSMNPSIIPSNIPSNIPSMNPSMNPSLNPSLKGKLNPTEEGKEGKEDIILNNNIYTSTTAHEDEPDEQDRLIDKLDALGQFELFGEG